MDDVLKFVWSNPGKAPAQSLPNLHSLIDVLLNRSSVVGKDFQGMLNDVIFQPLKLLTYARRSNASQTGELLVKRFADVSPVDLKNSFNSIAVCRVTEHVIHHCL